MSFKKKTELQKGTIAIVLVSIIYGMLPLVPRYLSTSFEMFQQIYLRLFSAFLLVYIIFHKTINLRKIIRLSIKDKGWVFLRAFLYYFLGVGLYTYAILNTKISNVAFIGSIPTTAVLGFIFLRERITLSKVLLVLLSAFGVAVISVKEIGGVFNIGIGEIAALLSALSLSFGLITRKWHKSTLNDQEIALLMLLSASIQFLIASVFLGEGYPVSGWSNGIIFVVFLGGLMNAGLSFFMNYGLARVEAVFASNLISLDAIFATLFALILFREFPTSKELFGGILIIASAVLLHRHEKNTSNSVIDI